MQINRLQVNNFKRLSGLRSYEFPSGIIGISGPNGSGKSTLLNAIAYVFYGPEVLPGGKSNVVTWGADSARVDIEFDIDGDTYRVMRGQKSSGVSTATLSVLDRGRWVEKTDGLEPTTRSIEQLFGIDRVGFLVSVFSRQEELAGLSSLTPATRMRTVLRLLGIDRLTTAADSLRADARALRRSIDMAKENLSSIGDIDGELEEIKKESTAASNDIEEHANSLEQARTKIGLIKGEIVALSDHQKRYEVYADWLRARLQERAHAEGVLWAAQDALGGPEHDDLGPEPPPPDVEVLEGLRAEVSNLRAEKNNLKDAMQNSSCPFCHRPYEIDKKEIKARLAKTNNTLQFTVEELNREKADEERFNNWLIKQKYHNQCDKARTTITEIDEQIKSTPLVDDRSEYLRDARDRLAREESRAIVAEGSIDGLRKRLSDLTKRAQSLGGLRDRVEASRSDLARDTRLLANTEVAASEMGKLKEDMIGQIIPSLNVRASQLVSEMTDARYTELTLTPDYEIQYRNYSGELKDFENLSGGEKDIFALALRLALADVQAERLGVLILDEVMESLDSDRQELAWGALNVLTNRYNQIVVVTHVTDFKERAPHAITV